jgi:capsular polysaccharide biosynthesis protein
MTRLMPEAPAQPVRVLNYDPLTRSYQASRLRRQIIFVLICGVIGTGLGFFVSPTKFRANAYVTLPSESQQQAAVNSMLSPTALAAGVASARTNGVTFTPAQVSKRLQVRAIPNSQLVEVAGVEDTPEVAAAIVGGVINQYTAANPSATMVAGPSILARQQLQPMFILAGTIAGLIGGWIVVTLRKR